MRIKERLAICRALGKEEFFTPAAIENFVTKSRYKRRKLWVETINNSKVVGTYLNAHGDDICHQRKNAFRELCLIELQECEKLPEVMADELVSKYMHMVEGLYDGSLICERYKLQNAVNKLELKILHSISGTNKTLVKVFLKIACLYSYKMLDYHTDDKKALEKLCSNL